MSCSQLGLSVLAGVVGTCLLLPGIGPAQTPAPGQGGFYNGVPRDYDSFLGSRSPGGLTGPAPILPPSSSPLAPLRSLGTGESMRYLPGQSARFGEGQAGLAGDRVAPWLFQAGTGCYYAVAVSASGITYYWVYWLKEPRYFYCWSPIRERYVGLYDPALRLYRPYNGRAKQWEEASFPPVLPPPEPPDVKAKPNPAPVSTRALPEPPAFKVELTPERLQPRR